MRKYDTYKDSGIEWIGEIPEHWEVKRGDSLFNLQKNIKRKSDLRDNEVFHYSIPAIQQFGSAILEQGSTIDSDKFVLEGNEILFSKLNPRKGTVVISSIHTGLSVASTEFVILKPIKGSMKYLFYFFLSDGYREHISSLVESATKSHQRANPSDIYKSKVCFPPLPEQTAIAAYLDRKTAEIDELIESKRRLLELYEEEKTAIINQAVTRGINPDAPMKDSGIDWLGEVPEDWEVKRLKYVICGKLKYGANEPADQEIFEHPRYIRITDFGNDGKLSADTFKSLPPEKAAEYLIENGDILFARSGATVGKTYQFKNYVGSACFAGYLIKATPNPSIMDSDFLYAFTKSGCYDNWKNRIFNQATIQNIGADKYSLLPIPVPTIEEQQAIVSYLETEYCRIDTQKARTQKLIDLLTEYRTALISEVVTGKVRVV